MPPYKLLGSPINSGNGFLPTWRNILRLGEMEWLRDNQINSKTVFPRAGYIASTIEAMRLLTDPLKEIIRGYQLRDIDIINTLVIPESNFGVET